MTRVSDRFLQLAVVLALVGMGLGIGMGISQNFQLQPVHAHINLLGWVSMTLYGLVYRVVPKAAAKEESEWLKTSVYAGRSAQIEVEVLDAKVRFSGRQGPRKVRVI